MTAREKSEAMLNSVIREKAFNDMINRPLSAATQAWIKSDEYYKRFMEGIETWET